MKLRFSSSRLQSCAKLVCVATFLVGCNSEPSATIEKTVPVAGVLTYKGQPLEYHEVMFFPTGARPAAGTTDDKGQFTLGTNRPGDGAVVGKHKVTVKYVGPTIQQEPGKETVVEIPPPKVKIPESYMSADTSRLTQEVPASGIRDLKLDLQ